MVNTLEIDKTLLQEALDLSNHPTPNILIEATLCEYIQRRKQLKILELLGTIDYDNVSNFGYADVSHIRPLAEVTGLIEKPQM
ncbi:type II toxin-antitoxin system VapB family antitoxin [Lyngbya sp. CCAP 1446/10]|uniref:type II toxin-antitoxin system VapB family antitoxin n=1 Tax=Lyngbya sp. CCAP 1446/10 TaxID=439293 RepID=UPI0022376074|nr:type II toxin-antitoxin system VapB family antitoxin [Lyngbya sp. CCAP 1446/10]MCW6051646.1 type II toxin-antitoxin system VapB family antitoxin [Lyngbya sp. CCAP 1446/10]